MEPPGAKASKNEILPESYIASENPHYLGKYNRYTVSKQDIGKPIKFPISKASSDLT